MGAGNAQEGVQDVQELLAEVGHVDEVEELYAAEEEQTLYVLKEDNYDFLVSPSIYKSCVSLFWPVVLVFCICECM